MTNIKKIVSVLFSAILLFSATATNSIAIDKIHFRNWWWCWWWMGWNC